MPKYYGFIRTTDAGKGTSDMFPMKSEKPFILVHGLAKVGEFDTKEQAEQEKAKRTAIDAYFTFAHVREFQEGGEFVQV